MTPEALLASLTLEQKVAQLSCVFLRGLTEFRQFTEAKAKAQLANGIGWLICLQDDGETSTQEAVNNLRQAQAYLRQHAPGGIPAIMLDESICGVIAPGAVVFPQAHNQSQTWNPALTERWAAGERERFRTLGITQVLSPVLDIAREPRWGRCEETYGEDPVLSAAFGIAYTRGLRGDDLKNGVAAIAKHFAGYSACEGGHNFATCHVTPRDFHDNFTFPFEAAIREGGLAALMMGYHDIDGVPCVFNRELMTTLLRDKWGWDGLAVTDFFSLSHQYAFFYKVCRDARDVTTRAKLAGLDVEMPTPDHFRTQLPALVREGVVPESLVDASVLRVLQLKQRLGLLDSARALPPQAGGNTAVALRSPALTTLSREMAEQSLVLLKNDADLLPLTGPGVRRIAVIGPCADNPGTLLADYAFGQARLRRPDYYGVKGEQAPVVTILDGLRARAATAGITVDYAPGCPINDFHANEASVQASQTRHRGSEVHDLDTALAQAVATAQSADVIIAALGEESMVLSGEGHDRHRLELPTPQEALLRALARTGKPLVLVLTYGRPQALAGVSALCRAIVAAGYPGEQGGHAVARLLFGDIEPSGRLTMSWPQTTGHTPAYYARHPNSPNCYCDFPEKNSWALFPFGHGLAYTRFAYDALALESAAVAPDSALRLTFTVSNTGARSGVAVPQVYIQGIHKSVLRPLKELKAFARVELAPGESKTVRVEIPAELLAFHGIDQTLNVEAGRYEVMAGSSAADIHAKQFFTVTAARPVARRTVFGATVRIV
jgi:beta-glucosidase